MYCDMIGTFWFAQGSSGAASTLLAPAGLCSGVALACAYDLFLTRAQAVAAFGASFLVLTIVEVLRLRYAENAISKFLFARFRKIARDYETDQVSCARPASVSRVSVPGPTVALLDVCTHSFLSMPLCRSVADGLTEVGGMCGGS